MERDPYLDENSSQAMCALLPREGSSGLDALGAALVEQIRVGGPNGGVDTHSLPALVRACLATGAQKRAKAQSLCQVPISVARWRKCKVDMRRGHGKETHDQEENHKDRPPTTWTKEAQEAVFKVLKANFYLSTTLRMNRRTRRRELSCDPNAR